METLAIFVRLEMWFLLGSLMLIVGYQILTGRINTNKMLFDKGTNSNTNKILFDKGTNSFSPGRVQLLMLTLIGALHYMLQVTQGDPMRLPDVPQELLLLLGGSNVLYLGGKGAPLLSSLFRVAQNPNGQTPQ